MSHAYTVALSPEGWRIPWHGPLFTRIEDLLVHRSEARFGESSAAKIDPVQLSRPAENSSIRSRQPTCSLVRRPHSPSSHPSPWPLTLSPSDGQEGLEPLIAVPDGPTARGISEASSRVLAYLKLRPI
ncbi:MAG: hypothetical protein QXE79_06525 [Candidatus Bathyarchaeia archaeon]